MNDLLERVFCRVSIMSCKRNPDGRAHYYRGNNSKKAPTSQPRRLLQHGVDAAPEQWLLSSVSNEEEEESATFTMLAMPSAVVLFERVPTHRLAATTPSRMRSYYPQAITTARGKRSWHGSSPNSSVERTDTAASQRFVQRLAARLSLVSRSRSELDETAAAADEP